MTNRSVSFATGEFYHCFNRGVDKRDIFIDAEDFDYFVTALALFNQNHSFGDMRHYKQVHADATKNTDALVSILAYCLNPNHFHLLVKQEGDGGITKFMRKIGTGYTMYFNKKYDRSGSLFQGQFKSVHVSEGVQLRHLFAYVTKNNVVHGLSDEKKFKSSYADVTGDRAGDVCDYNQIDRLFGSETEDIIESGIEHTLSFRESPAYYENKKSDLLE